MSGTVKITCTQCSGTSFTAGYLGSSGNQDRGTYERWYDGPIELGMFGDVKHASSRSHFQVVAARCQQCGHLELFARTPD